RLGCCLRLLYKAMKQHHFRADDGEKHPGNSLWNAATYFPQPWLHLANNRHSNWPAKLDGLDVGSGRFSRRRRNLLDQPFANGLPAYGRAVKVNGQKGWHGQVYLSRCSCQEYRMPCHAATRPPVLTTNQSGEKSASLSRLEL